MIAKDDIVIRKAILHILDTNRGECILSNTLLDPSRCFNFGYYCRNATKG